MVDNKVDYTRAAVGLNDASKYMADTSAEVVQLRLNSADLQSRNDWQVRRIEADAERVKEAAQEILELKEEVTRLMDRIVGLREQHQLDIWNEIERHKAEHRDLNKMVEHLTTLLVEARNLVNNPPVFVRGEPWPRGYKRSCSHWGLH